MSSFNADVIITHVRRMAASWRQQELDCLNTPIIPPADLADASRVRNVLKREIDAMKAHQSAIILETLANDFEDLKQKLAEQMVQS